MRFEAGLSFHSDWGSSSPYKSPANYYPFHIQTFLMWAILIVLTIASECMQVNSTIPTSQTLAFDLL